MNQSEQVPKLASVSRNQDFYRIYTESGRGLVFPDFEMPQYEHPLDVPNNVLGRDVLAAVMRSRQLGSKEFSAIFQSGIVQRNRDQWERETIQKYGYKSRRNIYRKMDSCSVILLPGSGVLKIQPSHHDTLDGHSSTKSDGLEDVLVSSTGSDEEIGAAVRLAFERCTSSVP